MIEYCRVELDGRKSAVRIFQETPLKIHQKIKVKGDLGYVGVQKVHARSQIPHKNRKMGDRPSSKKGRTRLLGESESKLNTLTGCASAFEQLKKPTGTD